ncbi:MAG: hypothetical protein KAT34_17810 [Candidatus Aminicenantes bacterium]|nr:hypothetical protein [Candidatus Aminicenantes bacterium]
MDFFKPIARLIILLGVMIFLSLAGMNTENGDTLIVKNLGGQQVNLKIAASKEIEE